MSDVVPAELGLQVGEVVVTTQPAAAGVALVSDGNSRWEQVGDTLYFVVNDQYKAPKDL